MWLRSGANSTEYQHHTHKSNDLYMPESGGASRISRHLDLPIRIPCLFRTFRHLQRTNGLILLTASAPNYMSIPPRLTGYLAQSISQYASSRHVRCVFVFELVLLLTQFVAHICEELVGSQCSSQGEMLVLFCTIG
jgi:hypothetical protein